MTGTVSRKEYEADSDRDLMNYSVSPSFFYQISPKSFFRLGGTFGTEECDLDIFANESWSVSAMYGHQFFNALQTTVNVSYTDIEYDGIENAYDKARHDQNLRAGLNISYTIPHIATDLSLSYTYTYNDSNLDMYEYDRSQISASLSKTF